MPLVLELPDEDIANAASRIRFEHERDQSGVGVKQVQISWSFFGGGAGDLSSRRISFIPYHIALSLDIVALTRIKNVYAAFSTVENVYVIVSASRPKTLLVRDAKQVQMSRSR